ncbi:MAG: RagB/SusD family nutrient uptake outer membrane protein [Prolixibacteraceae bacterium]|jgi:hypothetical protein|nr:RagB/SusD family nutrient uptake outer membrane protein [Prolixibacteraceae bacterium]
MKNLKLIIFLFILCSCEDFLDRPPLDAIGNESYWKTAKDLENYVIHFYPSFPSHSLWQYGYGYPIKNADNAMEVTPNIILNGERGVTVGRWTNEWSNIRSVNIFFDNYKRCEDNFDLYKHFLGEAYFFRAWFYFELVKKYGDVPWYSTELLPGSSEELSRPRDPRTAVVDSILVDLDHAINVLSLRSKYKNNRISKEAALAFKTRVALYEGTWQKYHAGTAFGTTNANPNKYFQICVDAAQQLMNGIYQVGIYNDYYKMFGLDDMSSVNEILLYRAYNIKDGVFNDVQYQTTFSPFEVGITWSLVSTYLDKNGKPYDYLGLASTTKGNAFLTKLTQDIDPRCHAAVWVPGDLISARNGQVFQKPSIDQVGSLLNPTGFQLRKCSNPNSPGAGANGGGTSETGYILFRYGEVLLNYAEALYELQGVVATNVLNLLRARAGMPAFTVNPQNSDPNWSSYGYSISDALYEIRRERRVELALEGFREDDYRRWAAHKLFKGKRPKGYPFDPNEFPAYHPPLDENGLIDYMKNTLPAGYQFRENQDYLSSIPAEELNLNPNLTQNPGWQ